MRLSGRSLLLACLVHASLFAVSLGASDSNWELSLVRWRPFFHLLLRLYDRRLLDRLWLNNKPDLALVAQLGQFLLGLVHGSRVL